MRFVSLGDDSKGKNSDYNIAVTNDNVLYAWTINKLPFKIADNVDYAIPDFYSRITFLTRDGLLYYYYYYLDENWTGSKKIEILKNVKSFESISGLLCGAITTDGALYMWGNNDYGDLGNGTNVDSDAPVKVLVL